MVFVNEIQVQVSQNDTLDTLVAKVAAATDTLPEYLYLPFKPTDSEMIRNPSLRIQAIDIVSKAKDASSDIDFSSFFEYTRDKWNIGKDDILKIWLAYNEAIKNPMFTGIVQLQIESEYGPQYFDFDIGDFIEGGIDPYISHMNTRINSNKRIVARSQAQRNEFDALPVTGSTRLEIDKMTIRYKTDITDKSVYAILDSMILSDHVPFAVAPPFYKFVEAFVPDESWYIGDENKITTRVILPTGNLLLVIVYQENNTTYITIQRSMDDPSSEEYVLDKIGQVIPGFAVVDRQVDMISGIFYLPNTKFEKSTFVDMVFNNTMLSTYLNTDQSIKVTKNKTGVFVTFEDKAVPGSKLTANITPQVASSTDQDIQDYIRSGVLVVGNSYTKVNVVRAATVGAVEHFQTIFGKLMSVYTSSYQEVVNYYRKYIPDFPPSPREKMIVERDIRLKDIVPDLFLPGYRRNCIKAPVIITEEQSTQYDDSVVMRFPRNEEEGPVHVYTCEHDTHPYPGLRVNKLANADKYPLIPCCFKDDQNLKVNSRYKEYFHGGDNVRERKGQQRLGITRKLAPPEEYYELPEQLEAIFSAVDSTSKYLRMGVSQNQNSFLHCVANAMDKAGPSSDADPLIRDMRGDLASRVPPQVSKQELYDMTEDQIAEMSRDESVYLDPRLFVRLVEEYFDCNIYVFYTAKDSQDIGMLIPRHKDTYYRFEPKQASPTVVLYAHHGVTSDRAIFEQCEVIVRYNSLQRTDEKTTTSGVAVELNKIFTDINQTHDGKRMVLQRPRQVPPVFGQQWIDGNGKCRALGVGTIKAVLSEPFPPFALPIITSNEITNVETTISFAEINGLSVLSQVVNNDTVKGILCKIPSLNTKGLIRTTPHQVLPGITVNKRVHIPSHGLDSSLEYSFLKKWSVRYQQCFMHYYSQYAHESQKIISPESLRDFVEERVVVRPITEYKPFSESFSASQNVYLDGNAFVVDSQETLKRLLYGMSQEMSLHSDTISNYHELSLIPNFYSASDDFSPLQKQIVLQSIASVQLYRQSLLSPDKTVDTVLPDATSPYYLKTQLILDNNICIVHPANSLAQAMAKYRALTWSSGVNSTISFTVYLYNSKTNVTSRQLGERTSRQGYILSFKNNDSVQFAVLFPFF